MFPGVLNPNASREDTSRRAAGGFSSPSYSPREVNINNDTVNEELLRSRQYQGGGFSPAPGHATPYGGGSTMRMRTAPDSTTSYRGSSPQVSKDFTPGAEGGTYAWGNGVAMRQYSSGMQPAIGARSRASGAYTDTDSNLASDGGGLLDWLGCGRNRSSETDINAKSALFSPVRRKARQVNQREDSKLYSDYMRRPSTWDALKVFGHGALWLIVGRVLAYCMSHCLEELSWHKLPSLDRSMLAKDFARFYGCFVALWVNRGITVLALLLMARAGYLELRRRALEAQVGSWTHLTASQRKLYGLPPGLEDQLKISQYRSRTEENEPRMHTKKPVKEKQRAENETSLRLQQSKSSVKMDHTLITSAATHRHHLGQSDDIQSKLMSSTSPTKVYGEWCSPETTGKDFVSPPLKSRALGLSSSAMEPQTDAAEEKESAWVPESKDETDHAAHGRTRNINEYQEAFHKRTPPPINPRKYDLASRSSVGKSTLASGPTDTSDRLQEEFGVNTAWLESASAGLKKWLAFHISHHTVRLLERNTEDIAKVSGGYISTSFLMHDPGVSHVELPHLRGRKSFSEILHHFLAPGTFDTRYAMRRAVKRSANRSNSTATVYLWEERAKLDAFLDVGTKFSTHRRTENSAVEEQQQRSYVLRRLRALSEDDAMSQYRHDISRRTSAAEDGTLEYPTDGQIILHYFLTLMDTILSNGLKEKRNKHEFDSEAAREIDELVAGTERYKKPGPFTKRLFWRKEQLPHFRYLMNLPILHLCSTFPMHVRLIWDGRPFEVEQGSSNLWQCLTLYLYTVDSKRELDRRLLQVPLEGDVLYKVFR
eukprot:gb/GECG01016027.1/.p1 GENE.gb/GECG01016027.1/~~gb/GECG01016027.1/.p1  ORF type:complete len:824 (+),score=85.11 gb/GECG01016027.1/:1-2472(+)